MESEMRKLWEERLKEYEGNPCIGQRWSSWA
jgi:hypothetical protein